MYFNIRPYRDLLNEYNPRKIKGITVTCGYNCQCSHRCPHGNTCKYKGSYKWHNFSVAVSRFFYYKFHVNFHFPIYFQRKSVDLSGTTKCPHKMERLYTCYDCIYLGFRTCTNEEYQKSSHEECFDKDTPIGRCKFFELNPIYADYNKKTGEII